MFGIDLAFRDPKITKIWSARSGKYVSRETQGGVLGLEKQAEAKCCGSTEEVEGDWGRFVEELTFELGAKGKEEAF